MLRCARLFICFTSLIHASKSSFVSKLPRQQEGLNVLKQIEKVSSPCLVLFNGNQAWPIADTLNRRYLTGIRSGTYSRQGPRACLYTQGCSRAMNSYTLSSLLNFQHSWMWDSVLVGGKNLLESSYLTLIQWHVSEAKHLTGQRCTALHLVHMLCVGSSRTTALNEQVYLFHSNANGQALQPATKLKQQWLTVHTI